MDKKAIIKEAGVLLLTAVLLLSATAVTANTNTNKMTAMITSEKNTCQTPTRDVIWDNDLTYEGLLAAQYEPTYGELGTCADDFQLTAATDITSVHWIGGYFVNGGTATDGNFDWTIWFYNDDGTGNKPGTILAGPLAFPNAETGETLIEDQGSSIFMDYTVTLSTPVHCDAGVKYWIAFQGQGVYPPQSGVAGHSLITLHEMVFKSTYFGYPTFTDSITVFGYSNDVAFQLISGVGPDTTPPVTTISLNGTQSGGVYVTPVTVTLTATDDNSGVNYTTYKIDDGTYNIYSGPFVVSATGTHTITYYSVDNAGNIETAKTSTFTIQLPIQITIKGGLGITATIKNTGTTNMSNIDWTIGLDGGLIILGKNKANTITTLAPGEEVTVKDFVLGFGKTTISVTADDAVQTATGTVLLILVIGVA